MHNYDKAKILKDRHIRIVIEWGGTDLFTNMSDMTIEGVGELLDILILDNESEINSRLTLLVKKEDERQEN